MNRAESTRCQRGIRGTHNYESTRWLKPEIPETNSVLCMSTYEGGSGHGVDSGGEAPSDHVIDASLF